MLGITEWSEVNSVLNDVHFWRQTVHYFSWEYHAPSVYRLHTIDLRMYAYKIKHVVSPSSEVFDGKTSPNEPRFHNLKHFYTNNIS